MFYTRMDGAKFTARTGKTFIFAANTALDGDGTMEGVFQAGGSGSMINSIRIKAIEPVDAGMIRFFLSNGEDRYLWIEVRVLGKKPGENASTFSRLLVFPRGSFLLESGNEIYVSTELAQNFTVIVEAVDWDY